MKTRALLIAATVAGTAAALATGLLDVTPAGLVGATWYGFPLPWLRRLVIAPQYYPWRIDTANLFIDLALWLTISVLIAWSAAKLSSRAPPRGALSR